MNLPEHNFNIESLTPINFCGNTVLWKAEIKDSFCLPYPTKPTEGEHDYTKCDTCQNNHKSILNELNIKYKGKGKKAGFPLCCPFHAPFVNYKNYNRSLFDITPQITADKVIFTIQHITNNINADNWYKDITDYIDYTVESFGQMPEGCGEPLFISNYFQYITDLTYNSKELNPERKAKILEFLGEFQKPKEKSNTDLNILISTYEKWYKIFPFDLSYFSDLKPYFTKLLPIINGSLETNQYSGVAKGKPHTKSSLIEALINLTNHYLTTINGLQLYEKGLITNGEKIKLELILSNRKLELQKGYKNDSPDEDHKYRQMLKSWFKQEKQFIDEITPLLKEKSIKAEIKDLENENTPANNIIQSTIEDWLYSFKQEGVIVETEYKKLVSALSEYFETGTFPVLKTPIKFSKVNVKRVGWALNQIYRGCKSNNETLPHEYLLFAKQNISIFARVSYNEADIKRSNLYKYFTSKVQ